jgi:hypothetical protein
LDKINVVLLLWNTWNGNLMWMKNKALSFISFNNINIWINCILKVSFIFSEDFFHFFNEITLHIFHSRVNLLFKSINFFVKLFMNFIERFLSILFYSDCKSAEIIYHLFIQAWDRSLHDYSLEFILLSKEIISLQNFFIEQSSFNVDGCYAFRHNLFESLVDLGNNNVKYNNSN